MWNHKLNQVVDVNMEPDKNAKTYDPDKEVKYFLHKKEHPSVDKSMLIDLRNIQPDSEHINTTGWWFIGIHGMWGALIDSPITNPLVKEIHKNQSANVIHVDWEDGAGSYWYPTNVANGELVGKSVAKVIQILVDKSIAKKELIHLVGFSLGGQVVGIVGHSIYKTGGWKPKRITSLDPARLSYEGYPEEGTIDPTDGEYVEVVHSSGGQLGVWTPHGHVDIYLNDGYGPQPGCGWDVLRNCSHFFAKRIYGDYNHLEMESYRCSSFGDFSNGNCNHDTNTACVLGIVAKTCKGGVYQLDTTRYVND
ncbi:unnamed protein product [Allacma fusca]|uniref:Lipase domain-containing protein n=1 Tax=Allacma fusca TaxID=39272 RepID=A0A8J2JXF0_9HEXA|nr:unnamed protein product [Allacma fusca]